jgi:hypothetical protein
LRALSREQGLRSGSLDEHGLLATRKVLLGLLDHQCSYHHTTAARMEKLEHRLERFGLILFGAAALTAATFLLVVGTVSWAGRSEMFGFLVTVLAASLPALGTASYGIRVIGDFEGIAKRSERTRVTLDRLIAAVEHDPVTLNGLRSRARGAGEAMLGDISSWRIAAESRSLNIPG